MGVRERHQFGALHLIIYFLTGDYFDSTDEDDGRNENEILLLQRNSGIIQSINY